MDIYVNPSLKRRIQGKDMSSQRNEQRAGAQGWAEEMLQKQKEARPVSRCAWRANLDQFARDGMGGAGWERIGGAGQGG